jgi:8-oxo-dGTP pyrophosphatase MutT (NUDIX family)
MPSKRRPSQSQPAPQPKPPGKARRERSAGVVVYRDVRDEAGAGRRLFLLLDYGRHWDYPKGHLEPKEDDRAAAERELREETGITGARFAEGFSHLIAYHFHSSRKGLIRKEVIFFAAKTDSEVVQLSEEHVGYAWLELEAALKRLTFENARAVLSAAAAFLDQHDPLGADDR